MNNDRNSRTQPLRPSRPGEGGGGWQRIPLPPLPHFRRPRAADSPATPRDAGGAPDEAVGAAAPAAPARAATAAPVGATIDAAAPTTALSLLGPGPQIPGPGHEGLPVPVFDPAPPPRSGDIGAAVLNDLVDQIERDIEKDLGRLVPETTLPPYRGAVPCTFDPAVSARGAGPAPPRPSRR